MAPFEIQGAIMARPDAVYAPSREGALQGLACATAHNALQRFAKLEYWARRAIPIMLVLFVGVLAAIAAFFASEARQSALAAAVSDLELFTAIIGNNIDSANDRGPPEDPVELLRAAIPDGMPNRGQQVFISDSKGQIVASRSSQDNVSGFLADFLGPMTLFVERSGALRIKMADGNEALATVRPLHAPYGQIALVHPLPAVLADWKRQTIRIAVLLAATVFVLSALGLAYFWQAFRTREAEGHCNRILDRIDTALNRGHCGLWDWDLARGRIYWSDSMYEILGKVPDRQFMLVSDVDALIHPEDGNLQSVAEMLTLSKTRAVDHMFRIQHARGEWIWLRARIEMIHDHPNNTCHLIGIALDITEQKMLAERTAQADMRLRDAIEAISEAFVLWDAENRLVMCNSKFQRFHNLHTISNGTTYAQIMANGTPPTIQTQIPLGETPQIGAQTYEARFEDGRWLQINERRTKDGGYVSVGADITALKANESLLLDSERRLMATVTDLRNSRQILEQQKQQLAELAEKYFDQKAEAEAANRAKSEFLANMSHELRTPLNAIIGFSEVMEQELYGPMGASKYCDYATDIKQSGQYLLNMISDVLDMSRLEAGTIRLQKTTFAIDQAISAAISNIEGAAREKSIMITAALPDTPLTADPDAVEKILTILLRNCVKFTPEYGRIAVRTRHVHGGLNIYVEDNGMGITPQALSRLGRPFEQLNHGLANGLKGSGLGLAIARSLIALHGGSMRIRSGTGKGTIVFIRFPNYNDPSQLKRQTTTPIAWHKLPLPALIDMQMRKTPGKVVNFART